ncbi:ketosteroid isomerase-like protein [Stella humosa]|uniref:Ketosteroid isomerase-like protein n=1 Tax=Stella humosa TaxID=94 RepID=A0A3N1MBC4_9PROT|nr:nuclear transport factor 2 family protein [Stella humosa]ROQ01031.1 ketosteroid isomerase-like protein [Stella humosa]
MATDRDDIRQAVDKLAQAIRRKDAAAVMALHAAEPVIYDLAPPLANSRTAARDPSRLEAWFATWRGDIAYEQRDLVIHQDGDLAVCHGFLRIGGTKVDGDGTATSVWTRQTLALRREAGAWRIFHVHESVPFHMDGSLRAAVELQP